MSDTKRTDTPRCDTMFAGDRGGVYEFCATMERELSAEREKVANLESDKRELASGLHEVNSDRIRLAIELSAQRANELFAALLEFHNAFCNRNETTSLHVWNERMKEADRTAVLILNKESSADQVTVNAQEPKGRDG